MLDYTIELINDRKKLERLIDRLASTTVMALDIETAEWWNRRREHIALIQLAYRSDQKLKVAIIDALIKLDFELLRLPLELKPSIKVIHNAVFDASRLAAHFGIKVSPIYDTMVAARRGGERRYSLKAQAETHLNLQLDKGRQTSDWSRRPLSSKQIYYAALDPVSTLLLYENQLRRKLNGNFQLKDTRHSEQAALPLIEFPESDISPISQDVKSVVEEKSSLQKTDLPPSSVALLGIITELPSRYHPDQLTVSVGTERVGLAGWIVDRILGSDVDFDEEAAKLGILDLCERDLVKITETRRLEATAEGAQLWNQLKSI